MNETLIVGAPQTPLKRVLLIRIGRLGDTILATPVIEAIRASLGNDVQIDFAISPGASAFLLGMDTRVHRIFAISHRSTPWRLHRVKRQLEQHSRDIPYDLVINLECGDECDDFARFVHYRKFCGRPLIEPAHLSDRHCVDTEKSIYAPVLGIEVTEAAETSLQLNMDPQSLPVQSDFDFVVINPGFSGIQKPGYRSHRAWPVEHWLRLVEYLSQEMGMQVLVNGTFDEQQRFDVLLQQPDVHSLFGSSLPTLVAVLSNARCLVTVDTGTMHLAAAMATPVVALFGPTNPLLTGPYSKNISHSVLTSGVDCQPCVNSTLQKKCTFNRCMSELEPERVIEAIQKSIRR